MSMMVSFCAVLFFPRGVLDEILNSIESVSEGFLPTLMEDLAKASNISEKRKKQTRFKGVGNNKRQNWVAYLSLSRDSKEYATQ